MNLNRWFFFEVTKVLSSGEMILILLFLYHQTSLVELLLWFILGINFHGKDC